LNKSYGHYRKPIDWPGLVQMLDSFLPWSLMTLATSERFFSIRSDYARARLHSPRSIPSIHSSVPSNDLFPDRSLNIRPDSFFDILRFIPAGSSLDIQG
jgi:hypothetical protein